MIDVWNEPPLERADHHMPQEILTRVADHVANHPWWIARARLVAELIRLSNDSRPQRILDVGCGWGVTLNHLELVGHDVAGLDIGRDILENLDKTGRQLILGDIQSGTIPVSAYSTFDVVMALDVLEHLDDDLEALRRLTRLVKPGGLVVVSVPARPDLWSEFDDVQGHKRRYVKEDLERLFASVGGLDGVQVSYCWPWLVPLARMSRRRSSGSIHGPNRSRGDIYERYVRPPSWLIRSLMEAFFRWSQPRILTRGQRDGTSLLAWARRRRPMIGQDQ